MSKQDEDVAALFRGIFKVLIFCVGLYCIHQVQTASSADGYLMGAGIFLLILGS